MSIKVIEFTSDETVSFRERKYNEFLKYYYETDLPVNDIFKALGLANRNSAVKYIRCRLKEDGLNTLKRHWCIRKGEWL